MQYCLLFPYILFYKIAPIFISDIAAMFKTILAQCIFDTYITAVFKILFPPIFLQHHPNAALNFNLILRQYNESTNIAYVL